MEHELSNEVRRLIYGCVPTLDALELLIGLVRRAPAVMSAEMLNRELRISSLGDEDVREYFRFLSAKGIIAEGPPGLFGYHPTTEEIDQAVQGLLRAHNERPVTLVRTVYDLADQRRLQAFSDAFRFKKDR